MEARVIWFCAANIIGIDINMPANGRYGVARRCPRSFFLPNTESLVHRSDANAKYMYVHRFYNEHLSGVPKHHTPQVS